MPSESGLLACGTVFIAPYNGSTPSNDWHDMNECDKFEIKENVTEKERKSNRCESYGQLASQVTIKQPTDLAIGFSTMNKENFAMLFLADAEDITIASGSFSDVLSVTKGKIVRVPHQNILTLAVTSEDGTTTTYTEGTDYEFVNKGMGLIRLLSDGAIANGNILFAGTTGEVSKVSMVGGSAYSRRFAVMFVGHNLDNDEPVTAYVHDVRLAPQSGVDFMSEDFNNGELTGKPVIDPVSGETYVVEAGHTFSS